jgi:hypothetical protein
MENGDTEMQTGTGPPQRYVEGVAPTPTMRIPVEFMTPLANAILEGQHLALPNDAATLAKALDVERRRVDDTLDWLRTGKVSVYPDRG